MDSARIDLMHIGIISDTHNYHHHVRRAIEIFRAQGVSCILHAGDITACSTASLLAELSGSRLIAVFGNCDTERMSLRSTIEALGGEAHDRTYDGQVDGKAIYMTHIPHGINQVVAGGTYDLVIYGHTHRQDIRRVGKTLIVNPGAEQAVIVDLADMSTTSEPLER
jgi:putative phosphoesterase